MNKLYLIHLEKKRVLLKKFLKYNTKIERKKKVIFFCYVVTFFN